MVEETQNSTITALIGCINGCIPIVLIIIVGIAAGGTGSFPAKQYATLSSLIFRVVYPVSFTFILGIMDITKEDILVCVAYIVHVLIFLPISIILAFIFIYDWNYHKKMKASGAPLKDCKNPKVRFIASIGYIHMMTTLGNSNVIGVPFVLAIVDNDPYYKDLTPEERQKLAEKYPLLQLLVAQICLIIYLLFIEVSRVYEKEAWPSELLKIKPKKEKKSCRKEKKKISTSTKATIDTKITQNIEHKDKASAVHLLNNQNYFEDDIEPDFRHSIEIKEANNAAISIASSQTLTINSNPNEEDKVTEINEHIIVNPTTGNHNDLITSYIEDKKTIEDIRIHNENHINALTTEEHHLDNTDHVIVKGVYGEKKEGFCYIFLKCLLRVVLNPLVFSIFIGVIYNLLALKFPEMKTLPYALKKTVNYLNGSVTPIGLIMLGLYVFLLFSDISKENKAKKITEIKRLADLEKIKSVAKKEELQLQYKAEKKSRKIYLIKQWIFFIVLVIFKQYVSPMIDYFCCDMFKISKDISKLNANSASVPSALIGFNIAIEINYNIILSAGLCIGGAIALIPIVPLISITLDKL